MANGNDNPLTVPVKVLSEIRGLYEGSAPEVAESRDCNAMRVATLARRFCVHPNTIFIRARSESWQRPDWYSLKRSPHPKGERYRAGGEATEALLAALMAAAGKPCPTNEDLATDLTTSANFVVVTLRHLRATKRIAIESRGNARRIRVVGASKWTAWTHCRRVESAAAMAPPLPKPDLSQPWERTGSTAMIRRRQKCHALLREAAEAATACPSDLILGQGVGCTDRTASRIVNELASAGAFEVEHKSLNVRRVVFADGKATGWTTAANTIAATRRRAMMARPSGRAPTVRPPVVSSRAKDAQLALQRMDVIVFDRWVVDGGAPGQSWCVDGKNVDAAGLIAIAEKRLGAARSA